MKKIALIALLAFSVLQSFGQATITYPARQSTLESWNQGFNTTSNYYDVPSSNSIALGTFVALDTITNTGTAFITVANLKLPVGTHDSFYATPLNGTGSITMIASVLKCTGTATVNATPYQNINGRWAPVPGVTTATLTPTSLTSSLASSVSFTFNKNALIYGVLFTGIGTQTSSVHLDWYDQKNVSYSPSK